MEVALARHAMATRFEILLHGGDPTSLRSAGEEALAEVERLEELLSLFRPSSEITAINQLAHAGPVQVSPEVFTLLARAREIWENSGGAFDPTVAPLVKCWGFMGGSGRWPEPESLAQARSITGMQFVELDPAERTVRFLKRGVMLDLGAIGKGYAIERAAELLREAGVTSALLHGGTSTVYGLGTPPDAHGWTVALDPPFAAADSEPLLRVQLRDEALSVSGVAGKWFSRGSRVLGHVLDPRTGEPTEAALLAAVAAPSATQTDAWSTALLVLGAAGQDSVATRIPGSRTVVGSGTFTNLRLHTRGF